MAFIKAHLILLITGVATLAFIVIAVLGMMSDSVVKKMQERAGVESQLKTLKTAPRNEECIEAERNRVARLQDEYQEVVKVAEEINARPPLMEGVFPEPERAAVAYDFRDTYRQTMAKLPRGMLAGGDLPTPAEIEDAKDEIAELQERLKAERGDFGQQLPAVGSGAPVTETRPAPAPVPAPAGVKPTAGGVRGGVITSGGGPTGGQAVSASDAGDPSKDPTARARIAKAHNIRCYVGTDPVSPNYAFSLSPLWGSLGEPRPYEMWYAQVALWVEEDVVAAVAELNEEAARQLPPEEAYVENMPVKRLQNVNVAGYYTDGGLVPFPSATRTGGLGAPAYSGESFTARTCNKEFDVVRFTVVAVVDQRAVTQLINAITKQNCYQLVHAKYDALGPASADYHEGYFYGTAPAVRLILDFEGYMARSVYSKWFPSEVRTVLGIGDDKGKKKQKKP
jgi:hypothetical protein